MLILVALGHPSPEHILYSNKFRNRVYNESCYFHICCNAILLIIIGLFLVVVEIIDIIKNYNREIILSNILLILGIIFMISDTFVSNSSILGF